MEPLPSGRMVMTANEAAAYGVVLSRAQAVGCYPITPQTLIVEKLADLVAGRDDVAFTNLESEHAMFGWVVAAARTGVRTFTATSSQGLLYAHEQLHRTSRERVPLVAVNVNRSILPPFRARADWVLDPDVPHAFSALPEPRDYAVFQRHVTEALEEAGRVVDTVAAEFAAHFGRHKTGALEVSGNPDASRALVTMATIGDTAQELLADDDDLLVVRIHAYRPFPGAELAELLAGAERVAVIDRAPAFGAFGPLGADVRALGIDATDVICGIGGTEVTPATLRWALDQEAALEPVHVPEGV
jgi:pyruvate/2-oxoacid:ferredoxin oxidoreductase alpha subunit